jgi:hypothetical protein
MTRTREETPEATKARLSRQLRGLHSVQARLDQLRAGQESVPSSPRTPEHRPVIDAIGRESGRE